MFVIYLFYNLYVLGMTYMLFFYKIYNIYIVSTYIYLLLF